ncbi:Oxysterol-binding protein-related protein 9 [Halocaridina rubra]|uniref:Oxysterol-binding protein-related protein 9 n=1 Tax=Halocaridina rubra TaxID=373956 RepID=A0AAN8WQT7_HALRR
MVVVLSSTLSIISLVMKNISTDGALLEQCKNTTDFSIDYDQMYEEEDESELGSMESHGSVIHHLLSQVKIGMDLTKVVLPTFILERRSLLEMYADFFAHPDLFCSIADMATPQDRMVQVVKWYLSAFHAGRKSEVAKKPYNPILGEIFRSILTVPWVELGGTCQITCSKTGHSANVEFLTKPFYGGKKHKISAEIFNPGEKKAFLAIEGEWNGVMSVKGKEKDEQPESFVDTRSMATVKKNVKPIVQQDLNESRYMWRAVTAGLKFNDIEQATASKTALEQKQRDEAKVRKENNEAWVPRLFTLVGDNWIYNNPLQRRISV